MSIAKDFLRISVFLSLIPVLYFTGQELLLLTLTVSLSLFLSIKHIKKYTGLKNKLIKQREYFIKTLSHDLRVSTLAQIRGLEILQKKLSDKEDSSLVADINDSCKYTLDMITMLLNTFRYENGEQVLTYESINIPELVSSCLKDTTTFADEKNVKLHFYPNKLPEMFEADRYSMEKLFTNLLLTAIFNSVKNGEIHIQSCGNADMARFTITYTGIPLSEEECRRMFSENPRFSTVGHGIRMHFCKKIIDFHGGCIKVSNKNGNINSFTFTIPVNKKQTSANHLPGVFLQPFTY